ncbi:MAG: hypothetical protein AABX23_04730 [Nanoarchaeota archaeon]
MKPLNINPILPRRDNSDFELLLAGAVPVGRFYDFNCTDTGGYERVYSRRNSDLLYEIKFRDPTVRGFLLRPIGGQRRSDLGCPYKTIGFEAEIPNLTLMDVAQILPLEEKGICVAFEVVHIGINCHDKSLAKMNLYKKE